MVAMRKRALQRPTTVEVQHGGQSWGGNYSVSGGRIDVWCEVGRKQTNTGGVPDGELAKMLLLEIVQDRAR
jgi:hypothetical protein